MKKRPLSWILNISIPYCLANLLELIDYHHSGGNCLNYRTPWSCMLLNQMTSSKYLLRSNQSGFFLTFLSWACLSHNIVMDRICFWTCTVHVADYLLFLKKKIADSLGAKRIWTLLFRNCFLSHGIFLIALWWGYCLKINLYFNWQVTDTPWK